jgi:hypothetical protein
LRRLEKVRILRQKKAQLARVALNPPKEEGGGELLHSSRDYARADAALQYLAVKPAIILRVSRLVIDRWCNAQIIDS